MKLIDADKLIEYIKEKECYLCICKEGTDDCVGCSREDVIFRIREYISMPENLIGSSGV